MLFIVAAGTLIMSLILLIRIVVQQVQIGKRKSWLTIEGQMLKNATRQSTEMVRKSAFKKKEALDLYFPEVEYTYTVNGIPYTNTVYSCTVPQGDYPWAHAIQTQYDNVRDVTIRYNPENPAQSFLVEDRTGIKTLSKSMLTLFAVTMGCVLLGLVVTNF